MNKRELIQKLAKEAEISLKEARTIVDFIFDARTDKGIIAREIYKGNKVTISGFGSFESKIKSEARRGVNPITGYKITIPAKKYAVFRAAKPLKESLKK